MKKLFLFLSIFFLIGSIGVFAQETLPFYEDFADAAFPPTGWALYQLNGGTTSNWDRHTDGGGSAYHNDFNAAHDSWLVSPQIILPAGNTIEISFMQKNYYMSWYGRHSLYVSSGSGDPASGDFVEIDHYPDIMSDFTFTWEDLSAYAGQDIYFAFVYTGTYASRWWVDDVQVTASIEGMPLPFSEPFDDAGMPDGWTRWTGHTSEVWSVEATNYAGGTPNELRGRYYTYTGLSRAFTPALNTAGIDEVTVKFRQYYNDYGAGCTIKVQYSTDGENWTDTGWQIASGGGSVGPSIEQITVPSTADNLYIAWVIDGDHFQINYWYIDDVEVYVDLSECPLEEALDNPDLTWTTSTWPEGAAEWYCQSNNYMYGGYSAQSGAVDDLHTTSIHTTVTGPGTLSFWWAIDIGGGFLDFYINGDHQGDIVEYADWEEMVYILPEGVHNLTWEFGLYGPRGDSSRQTPYAAWLDYVMFEQEGDGPDAAVYAADIFYDPSEPQPGDSIDIYSTVHNIGDMDITSFVMTYYWSLEPGVDLQLIDTAVVPVTIQPGTSTSGSFTWDTTADMDPRNYVITVEVTDVEPNDVDLTNNLAYIDLGLPVTLAYFTANGMGNQVNVRWMTMTEINNLGFNLYRLKADKISPFISFIPVQLNNELIPGQGTSSSAHYYYFTDYVKKGGKYFYILETVSSYDYSTEEFRTMLKWIF